MASATDGEVVIEKSNQQEAALEDDLSPEGDSSLVIAFVRDGEGNDEDGNGDNVVRLGGGEADGESEGVGLDATGGGFHEDVEEDEVVDSDDSDDDEIGSSDEETDGSYEEVYEPQAVVDNGGGYVLDGVPDTNQPVQVDLSIDLQSPEDVDHPLLICAFTNELETLQQLFEDQAEGSDGDDHWRQQVNVCNSSGQTPLFVAACKGHTDVTRLLLEVGADPNAHDDRQRTPLFAAALHGHLECLNLLLARHASPAIIDDEQNTLLHAAATGGKVETVEFILDHCSGGDSESEANSMLHAVNNQRRTALHLAAQVCALEVVDMLIDRGCDVDCQDTALKTPLHIATEQGWDYVVDILVDERANLHTRDENSRTPLHIACMNGHLDCIDLLVSNGADVQAVDKDLLTPLHLASMGGRPECVQLLLEGTPDMKEVNAADVHAVDNMRHTPLHAAACYGELLSAQLLIEHGAEVDAVDQNGRTPLFWAALRHPHVTKFLLSHSADPNATDIKGRIPLHYSCYYGNTSCALMLIKKGCNINAHDTVTGDSPLHASASMSQKEVIRLLTTMGADIDATDFCGRSPLFVAARKGDASLVEWLLALGAELNHLDSRGRTALHVAAFAGNMEVGHVLVDKGIVTDIQDQWGNTVVHACAKSGALDFFRLLLGGLVSEAAPLLNEGDHRGRLPHHVAAYWGHYDFLLFMVENKLAQVNSRDAEGRTALHHACYNGNFTCVKALLPWGAMVNYSDNRGRSPLHYAAFCGHTNCIIMLLEEGADVDWEDDCGQTPLDYAALVCLDGSRMEELIKRGADVNHPDVRRRTPLHRCVAAGNRNTMVYLIRNGAVPNARTVDGETPLHTAVSKEEPATVELMLECGALVNAEDEDERTPLHWSAMNGNVEVMELLIMRGAQVDLKDCDHQTAVDLAVKRQHTKYVHAFQEACENIAKHDLLPELLENELQSEIEEPIADERELWFVQSRANAKTKRGAEDGDGDSDEDKAAEESVAAAAAAADTGATKNDENLEPFPVEFKHSTYRQEEGGFTYNYLLCNIFENDQWRETPLRSNASRIHLAREWRRRFPTLGEFASNAGHDNVDDLMKRNRREAPEQRQKALDEHCDPSGEKFRALWERLRTVDGLDATQFRIDMFGNVIARSVPANGNCLCAWRVTHLFPWQRGGLTTQLNLGLMQWQAVEAKGDQLVNSLYPAHMHVGLHAEQFKRARDANVLYGVSFDFIALGVGEPTPATD